MKLLMGTLALLVCVALAIVFFPSDAQRVGPEEIRYGHDTCARCRMHLAQPGFAGELRDKKMQLTKYDDIGCLLIAMWKERAEVPEAWVEAHDTRRLIPLLQATLVVDSAVATPMGYRIIAFEGAATADQFATDQAGKIQSLEALLKDGARFRRKE